MPPGLAHGSDLAHTIIGPQVRPLAGPRTSLAMRVRRRLGPGLLESVYEACLCHEFLQAPLPFKRQVPLPVLYDDTHLDYGYLADIIVDSQAILELKSVERILPLHEAQRLTRSGRA